MGWQDRDYNADGEGAGAGRRFWSDLRMFLPPPATLALVLVHFVAYFAVLGVGYGNAPQESVPLALSSGYLSPYAVLAHPIAANSGLASSISIFVIWVVGTAVEQLIGPNRLFTLYVLGNVFSGIGYVAVAGFLPGLATGPLAVPLGAVLAWSVVIVRHFPYEVISLFGFVVRVMRFCGVVLAVAAIAALLRYRAGAAALAAGGLTAAGAAYVLEVLALRHAEGPGRRRRLRRRGRPQDPPEMEYLSEDEQPEYDEYQDDEEDTSINVDDLLEKISRSGIASLTPEERDRLEQARQERLRKEERSRAR